MSKYFIIAKANYEKGLWNRAMIEHLVELGRLTQEEANEILGE